MDKMARATRRARVIALRDAAADMVRLHGRGVGNIERDGYVTRIMMLERGRLRIELWEPRHAGTSRWEPKPTTYLVEIRFDAEVVLRVGWDGKRLNVVRYEPGGWERALASETSFLWQ